MLKSRSVWSICAATGYFVQALGVKLFGRNAALPTVPSPSGSLPYLSISGKWKLQWCFRHCAESKYGQLALFWSCAIKRFTLLKLNASFTSLKISSPFMWLSQWYDCAAYCSARRRSYRGLSWKCMDGCYIFQSWLFPWVIEVLGALH